MCHTHLTFDLWDGGLAELAGTFQPKVMALKKPGILVTMEEGAAYTGATETLLYIPTLEGLLPKCLPPVV